MFFSFKIGHDRLAYFSPVLRALWNQALGVLRFFDVLVKLCSYTDMAYESECFHKSCQLVFEFNLMRSAIVVVTGKLHEQRACFCM